MQIGLRLDTLPGGLQPEALTLSLVQAYAMSRAKGPVRTVPVRGRILTAGADAAACTIYSLPDENDKQQMEFVAVTARRNGGDVWAVYRTIRYSNEEINPIKWSHFRSAVSDKQDWDPTEPRTSAPALWPAASAFAQLGANLSLLEEAFAEAQAKADDIGPLTNEQVLALLDNLMQVADNDYPPTFEFNSYMSNMVCNRLAMCGPMRAVDVLLRNVAQAQHFHDFRAWIWQNIWAIGNRTARGPDQR